MHSDRNRWSLFRGLLCTTGAMLAACGGGGDEVWRFAIEETQGSVQDAYAREFERRVEERLGGEVDVSVFPYGTLGTSDDVTEQLRMGGLQFAMASPGHLGKTIPEIQALLLHFVFSDDDGVNQRALADPRFRAALEPLYEDKGLKFLSVIPEGWMVWTTKRPIREPADFEGVKIRTMTSPLLRRAYEAYGASPQAMPYAQVYGALQLNMIDAQVNPIFAIEEMSFYEVTSHLVRARPALFVTTLVTNPMFFDSLSPERRAVVEEVVRELDEFAVETQAAFNVERLETMRDRKPDLEVVELTAEERAAFRERSLEVRDWFVSEVGPGGERVLDALLDAIERAESEDR